MVRLIIVGILGLVLAACVSIPPQAITSQELTLLGIEAAYRNQITLINAYADDQVHNIHNLMEKVALDDVIAKQLNGRAALPADEIKSLILEYSQDLNDQIDVIERKRGEMLKIANDGYSELIGLTKTNLEFIKTAAKAAERQQMLIEDYKKQQNAIETKIKKLLSKEE